jgi:hypothetical protein
MMLSVKRLQLPLFILLSLNSLAQWRPGRVGIGTINPQNKLHIIDTLDQVSGSSVLIETESGNQTDSIYRGIFSIIKGSSGTNRAIVGYSYGESTQRNQGVVGFARYGVRNTGVRGDADIENPNGFNYGVYGSGAAGIPSAGVIGVSTSPNSFTNAINFGIGGVASSSNFSNIGVGGYAEGGNTPDTALGNNFGIVGSATSSSFGTNTGIYGEASGASTNYAGFFNGDVTITGTLNNPSDSRLKTNVLPLQNASSIIDKLRPVEFDYLKNIDGFNLHLPQKHQFGFIAQEVQTILPDLVSVQKINPSTTRNAFSENAKEGEKNMSSQPQEFLSVNYTSIIPILVQSIKEQQKRIEKLENMIIELQNKNK